MEPANYDYKPHVLGDTVKPLSCQINIDLTGATVTAIFTHNRERLIIPVTISDPTTGTFQVDSFTPSCEGVYKYDLKFDLGSIVRTYMRGELCIVSNFPE